jgi:hypothetical protein
MWGNWNIKSSLESWIIKQLLECEVIVKILGDY